MTQPRFSREEAHRRTGARQTDRRPLHGEAWPFIANIATAGKHANRVYPPNSISVTYMNIGTDKPTTGLFDS
jgi:hypothetical protein